MAPDRLNIMTLKNVAADGTLGCLNSNQCYGDGKDDEGICKGVTDDLMVYESGSQLKRQ